MDGMDAGLVVTAMLAIAALVISICTYFVSAAEHTYFEYTNRYREVLLGLPAGFLSDVVPLASIADRQEREQIPKVIQSYLDVCSEEVKLRLRWKVWGRVWHDWSDGIKETLMSKNVRTVLAYFQGGLDYRVLLAFLNHGLKEARKEYRHPPEVKWEPLMLPVEPQQGQRL